MRTGFMTGSRSGRHEELGHARSRRRRCRELGQAERFGREPQGALVLIPRRGPVAPLRFGAYAHPHDLSPSTGRVIVGFIDVVDQQTVLFIWRVRAPEGNASTRSPLLPDVVQNR